MTVNAGSLREIIFQTIIFLMLAILVSTSSNLTYIYNSNLHPSATISSISLPTRTDHSREDVKQAIERGLEYLNATQSPEGGWAVPCYGMNCNFAGNCLRAFLNYEDHGPWQENIDRASRFLLSVWHDPNDYHTGRDRDYFGGLFYNDIYYPTGGKGAMYSHGAATSAMLEYYLHTRNESLIPVLNASIEMTIRAQNSPRRPGTMNGPRSEGGWRYTPDYRGSDTSLTSWNVHPLVLAESHGIYDAPDDAFEYAEKWLKSCSSGTGFGYTSTTRKKTDTAVGAMSMYLMGRNGSPHAIGAKNALLGWGPIEMLGNYFYTYHSTFTMRLVGGQEWLDWRDSISATLLDTQYPEGSWYGEYGLVWGTAMAIMTLELCINSPFRGSVRPETDPDTGRIESLEKVVGWNGTASYGLNLSLGVNNLDVPPVYPPPGQEKVNVTFEPPSDGWGAELNLSSYNQTRILPDGTRWWSVELGYGDEVDMTLTVDAPEVGEYNESYTAVIDTSLENEYGIYNSTTTISTIFRPVVDFNASFSFPFDPFLGMKNMGAIPGDRVTGTIDIENLGYFNDTYRMMISSIPDRGAAFSDGRDSMNETIPTARIGNNSISAEFTVMVPHNMTEGETIDLDITASSFLSGELGLRTLTRTDRLRLVITEPALMLEWNSDNIKANAGDEVDFHLSVRNDYHQPLNMNFTVTAHDEAMDPIDLEEEGWRTVMLNVPLGLNASERRREICRVRIPDDAPPKDTFFSIYVKGTSDEGLEFHCPPAGFSLSVNSRPMVDLISPLNGSLFIDRRVNLSWTVSDLDGDRLSFDVYLGKNISDMTKLRTTKDRTTRTPLLDDHTTYYWTVIPHDPLGPGRCENGTWSFSINSTAYPLEAVLLQPINRSTIHSKSVKLKWNVYNPTEKDVYYEIIFGISREDLTHIGNTLDTVHTVEGLSYGKRYYWSVIPVTRDKTGVCYSGVWSFSVELLPEDRPSVESMRPTGWNVSRNSSISIFFNTRMNMTSVEDAFTIEPDVSGHIKSSGYRFSFIPDQPLSPGIVYRVSLNGTVRDAEGLELADFDGWYFVTEGDPEKGNVTEEDVQEDASSWRMMVIYLLLLILVVALFNYVSRRREAKQVRKEKDGKGKEMKGATDAVAETSGMGTNDQIT